MTMRHTTGLARLCVVAAVLGSLIACAGESDDAANPATTATTRTATTQPTETTGGGEAIPVTLHVGHCYIDPLVLDGERWLQLGSPIGSGGPLPPPTFTGTGTFTRLTDTTATYKDEAGLVIPFALDDGSPRECR